MGIKHVTHAFNAMRPFNHREPGAAGGVLMRPDVSCEFIGDGVHVHPQIISFLRRVKNEDKLVLITDALMPTAQPNGPFIPNTDRVVFEGGVWRRESDKVITGSALTLPQGIKNLVTWGYPLPQAVRCATANPAALLQLKNRGQIARGFQADILLLNKDFSPEKLFIGGEIKNIID
jgi:N-acetylglucosamine-6-phosphate deacetylase